MAAMCHAQQIQTETGRSSSSMRFEGFDFGVLRIDGNEYDRDIVIDRGKFRVPPTRSRTRWGESAGRLLLSSIKHLPDSAPPLP